MATGVGNGVAVAPDTTVAAEGTTIVGCAVAEGPVSVGADVGGGAAVPRDTKIQEIKAATLTVHQPTLDFHDNPM